MVAYRCENCKEFVFCGVQNEVGEIFCNESCYRHYCEEHLYEAHPEKLIHIAG